MSHRFAFRTVVLALGAALALVPPAPARAQSAAEEENVKQTTRQIADSISRRIAGGALTALPPPGSLNTWATITYNNIQDEENTFEINIVQTILGGDRRWGDFLGGISAAYSFSSIEQLPDDTNGFSISPYGAWIFSENFFVNAIAGYTRSDVENSQFNSNGAFAEAALNALYPVGEALVLKGKAGYRFTYSDLENAEAFGVAFDDTSHAHTALGGAEISYRLGPWTPYLRGQWEHFEPEGSDPKDAVDQDTLFSTVGLGVDVTEALFVGASFTAELFNSKTDNYGGAVEVRARF